MDRTVASQTAIIDGCMITKKLYVVQKTAAVATEEAVLRVTS